MRDDQCGAGEPRQPALQPHRRFEVEMVGRLVEQQQVGGGEQRGRQRHAHPPAARERFHRPRLRRRVEAKPGQDARRAGRRARRRRWCAAARAPRPAARPVRRIVGLGQQRQPLRSPSSTVSSRLTGRPTGPPALTCPMRARAARRISPPSRPSSPGDGAQQSRLAGAVAPDQPDPPPGIHPEVGILQQGAAAHADGDGVDRQQAHRLKPSWGGSTRRRGGGRSCRPERCSTRPPDTEINRNSPPWRPSARFPSSSPTPPGAT